MLDLVRMVLQDKDGEPSSTSRLVLHRNLPQLADQVGGSPVWMTNPPPTLFPTMLDADVCLGVCLP